MNIPFFDLQRQTEQLKPELEKVFNRVLKKGQFILGEEVEYFEKEFAYYIGVNHCVSCSNGTDAIELVLEAYGIKEGDEVILPAFGWVSASMAVERCGGQIVYVDVEHNSGNIDVGLVEKAITSRTKMVIATHLYGNPFDVRTLSQICSQHGVILIEDCAQAHGAVVDGRKVGGYGDSAIFSFYPTKNLGCFGDGGAVVTNDRAIAQKIQELRNYGRDQSGSFITIGRNSRMDEIQAAILRVKLSYLDGWNERRRQIALSYSRALGLAVDKTIPSVYYQYPLLAKDRVKVLEYFKDHGIDCKVHYRFILEEKGSYPNAFDIAGQVISMPIFPELRVDEVSYVSDILMGCQNDFVLFPL
ncbi:MAG: DegT/DnrJ/EryC1/StrS family aminotransferase [Marinoscillum sp.]